ncbi:MAG: DUF1015 family protein [Bacteroidia bacterium]
MAHLFPFKGSLPKKELVSEVVSRPFDSYSLRQVEAIIKKTPHSFLSIIKPELDKGKRTKPDNPEAQKKSRAKFLDFQNKGFLENSQKEEFYIYRQSKPDFVYTGILATIAAADYHNGTIKIHEQTLQRKEEKLKDYLKIVGINAEPVMFTYPHVSDIDDLMNHLAESEPYADFSIDGKRHQLWRVDEDINIEKIKNAFIHIEKVYVADGHHRSASSVLLDQELKEITGDISGEAGWSRYLGIFLPDHNMQLFEFNRLIKGLEKIDIEALIKKLSPIFTVTKLSDKIYSPEELHEFSMYADFSWYSLKLRADKADTDLNNKLDANLLTHHILSPVFGISDLRNDDRVDFSPGFKGATELKRLVDKGDYQLAFGLFPVSMEQFFGFSDQGRIMPPKTTWFEPKLLNGLVIYDIYAK